MRGKADPHGAKPAKDNAGTIAKTEALRDAAYVAAAFNVITRFADAIGARAHSEVGLTREQAIAHEGRFFDLGYA